MPSTFRRAVPPILLAASLLCGCASTQKSVAAAPSSATAEPIWRVGELPWPLGPVSIVQGSSATVSLVGTATSPIASTVSVAIDPPSGLRASIDGSSIRIDAAPDASGLASVVARVLLEDGTQADLGFPVVVDNLPMVDFAFAPPAGTSPKDVSVAGEFNGWAAGANPMVRGDDGTFALKMPVMPGTWSYKLVVDGEWISDPANPRTNSSGYGNSILEVSGSVLPPLDIRMVSSAMHGGSGQGGVWWNAPLGGGGVRVWLNNRELPAGNWTIAAVDGGTQLDFAVPSDRWQRENHVVVAAHSGDGRRGTFAARFDDADAPRSPLDEVLYFAMTDRFRNGDPSNDPKIEHPELHPLANYHGGDWAGIREKIEDGYFTDLGVTTIWISPPNRNTMNVERDGVPPHRFFSSYHGYWPVSLTETNPAFGSMDDLKSMVDAAHARGIAVLIDFVGHHVHKDHPLYAEYKDATTPLELPDGTLDIRKFDANPFTTWFDTFLPTLDYGKNAQMLETMTDNGVWWIETTGADGFRQDAVKHVPEPFWRMLTAKIDERFAQRDGRLILQIGETISDRGTISRFIGPELLHGQFDFPMLWAIQGAIAREEGTMSDLAGAIEDSRRGYPSGAVMSPLVGNHDVPRFLGIADDDIPDTEEEQKRIAFEAPPVVDDPGSYEKLELAYALLYALPGPPTLYYGDEIGMTGSHDPDNRRPMMWDGLAPEQNEIHQLVAHLGRVRAASPALRRGTTEVLQSDDETLALARIAPDEVVVALYGRRKGDARTIDLPAYWGTPKEIEILANKGIAPSFANGGIAWTPTERSFAICRITW